MELKMTSSIDHMVKKCSLDEPNSISPESVKNIACTGKKIKQDRNKKSLHNLLKPAKNNESEFGPLVPLGG